MISLPRSASCSPAVTALSADCWCGRRDFFAFSATGALGWKRDQSIWLASRSCRVILLTGGCWSISAFSALSD